MRLAKETKLTAGCTKFSNTPLLPYSNKFGFLHLRIDNSLLWVLKERPDKLDLLVYCSKEFRSLFSDSLSVYIKAQPFFNFGLVSFFLNWDSATLDDDVYNKITDICNKITEYYSTYPRARGSICSTLTSCSLKRMEKALIWYHTVFAVLSTAPD